MTKAEHKQRAMDLSYRVKDCYSRPAKKKVVSELLAHLRQSLKGI